jgi:hypothetical protein
MLPNSFFERKWDESSILGGEKPYFGFFRHKNGEAILGMKRL